MPAKILLIAASLLLAMVMAGCGTKGCSTATPGSTGGTSGGTAGGASAPPGACSLGSGGGGPTNSQRALVYFMVDDAGQIAGEGLNINSAGTFASLMNFVPPQMPVAVTDGGVVIVGEKYLYVPLSNASTGSVFGYSIDGATGALSPLNNSPYAVNGLQGTQSPFSIAADPAGNFVFVGDAAGITVFAVNPNDGSLTPVNTTPVSGIGAPVQMATDGLGKYLYAVDGVSIAQFSYNSSGALTPLGSVTSSLTDMAMMTGEPSGKWMLGVRAQVGQQGGALDLNVYVFAISSTGALTSAIPTSTPFPPTYVVVSPNDKFVYTFNEDDTSTTSSTFLQPIVGFTFNPTSGALTNATPFPDVLSKIGHMDQSGQVLIAAGQSAVTVAAGTVPITVLSDGTLSSSSSHAGLPSFSFAVTDTP
ncbi:MAG TPA: beta-propeller fold lactonase family protein [Candidatus Sulfotelmatobacter sp.]|nr:beta-propeller fold lactonase family protein [Candidatus Sulfotelmatobacter sp.]